MPKASNVSFIRKGKASLGCTSSYYHNLRTQYHTRHIQVSKLEALASSTRPNPDYPETHADSACIEGLKHPSKGTLARFGRGLPLLWGNGLFLMVVRTFPVVRCGLPSGQSGIQCGRSAVRSQNREADHPISTGQNSTNGRSPLRCSLLCRVGWCTVVRARKESETSASVCGSQRASERVESERARTRRAGERTESERAAAATAATGGGDDAAGATAAGTSTGDARRVCGREPPPHRGYRPRLGGGSQGVEGERRANDGAARGANGVGRRAPSSRVPSGADARAVLFKFDLS